MSDFLLILTNYFTKENYATYIFLHIYSIF